MSDDSDGSSFCAGLRADGPGSRNGAGDDTRGELHARREDHALDGLAEALAWWQDKCPYCIGRERRASDCLHTVQSCKSGGAQQRMRGLGELIHLEGMRVERGCPSCALPLSTCGAEQEEERWLGPAGRGCRYGCIVYDVVICLYRSANEDNKKLKFFWLLLEMQAANRAMRSGDHKAELGT